MIKPIQTGNFYGPVAINTGGSVAILIVTVVQTLQRVLLCGYIIGSLAIVLGHCSDTKGTRTTLNL